MNKNFLAKLNAFVDAAIELDLEWSNLKGEYYCNTADGYPFQFSFDEMVNLMQQWEFTQKNRADR